MNVLLSSRPYFKSLTVLSEGKSRTHAELTSFFPGLPQNLVIWLFPPTSWFYPSASDWEASNWSGWGKHVLPLRQVMPAKCCFWTAAHAVWHTLRKSTLLSTLVCMHELSDPHNWIMSLWMTGETILPPFPPRKHGQICSLWHHQNSTSQSANNSTNTFLLCHSEALPPNLKTLKTNKLIKLLSLWPFYNI